MRRSNRMVGAWLAGVLVCAALVGCQATAEDGPGAPATSAVDVSSLPAVVSAEGIVVPVQQADLSFNVSGRVAEVLVSEGDSVRAGQPLARLDTRDLDQAVKQAQANLASAKAQLAKAEAGARAEEISSAKAAVAIAKAGVQSAQIAVQVSAGNLASAKGTLANAVAGVESAEIAVEVVAGQLASAKARVASSEASLNKLLTGPTERELRIAEKQLEMAKNELWGLQGQRDALGGRMGADAEYEAAQGQVAAGESRVDISQLQLEELRGGARAEDVAAARAACAQAEAGVQTAEAQWEQARSQVQSAKAVALQAEAGVTIAQAQLDLRQVDIESAEAGVRQAQALLDQLEAGSRPEDIDVAAAAVAQAEAQLVGARNALTDAVLAAPFDGTVGAVMVDEGELAGPALSVLRIGDLSALRLETEDLSEVDVSLVEVGDDATVTVDAIEGTTLSGTVVRIAPIATDRRGDRVYTVLLDLGAGPDSGLRWGMSAYVEIAIE